jgi:hypothetical protein
MIRTIIFIIATILLALVQISFLNSFDVIRQYSHLVLVVAVFITTTIGYRRGFLFTAVAGLTLDCYSSFGFGAITISMLLPIIAIYYLFRTWLAHKSFYSIALVMLVSTLIYSGTLWLLVNSAYWLNWHALTISMDRHWLAMAGGQLISSISIIAVLYTTTRLIRQKIKSRFFISEHA